MARAYNMIGRKGQRVDPVPCKKCGGPMTAYESRMVGYHQNCEPKKVS
jgi:hypothetical protein